MANAAEGAAKGGFRAWLNKRLPVDEFMQSQLVGYYAPKNFNIWYFFGSLALLVFVIQIVTGIFLTMNYKPGELTAFDSVEYIMREVEWGWLIRYLHSTGASFFFIVVYLHMFRALMYGSYRAPRELLWILGMFVYLALMAEAFMGYVLPWGNMSYWGAQVIVNLFGTIPAIGPGLVEWIRGDYGIADATLNRFFALHVIALPFAIALLRSPGDPAASGWLYVANTSGVVRWPVRVETGHYAHPVAPEVYDCVKFLLAREGSGTITGDWGERRFRMGDLMLVGV